MTTDSYASPKHSPENIDAVREEIHMQQAERIVAQKEAMVASPELRVLLGEVTAVRAQAEGRELPDMTSYEDFGGLHKAIRTIFDFRTNPDGTYGERWEAERNAQPFLNACSPELKQRIYSTAEMFGLTGETAPESPYAKAGVILGGGGKAPLDRTQYAADLISEGKFMPEMIISLGSDRPIDTKKDEKGENEYDRAGAYAEGAKDEYDLMVKAAEVAFNAKVTERDVIEWTDPRIQNVYADKSGAQLSRKHKVAYIPGTDEHPPIFIISSAVITDPFRTTKKNGVEKEVVRDRVNTEDTFATLARVGGFEPGSKLIAFTNMHFVPFQGAAASAQLGEYGLNTEVVGFDPQRYGNTPKKPHELLQEMATLASSLSKAKK